MKATILVTYAVHIKEQIIKTFLHIAHLFDECLVSKSSVAKGWNDPEVHRSKGNKGQLKMVTANDLWSISSTFYANQIPKE